VRHRRGHACVWCRCVCSFSLLSRLAASDLGVVFPAMIEVWRGAREASPTLRATTACVAYWLHFLLLLPVDVREEGFVCANCHCDRHSELHCVCQVSAVLQPIDTETTVGVRRCVLLRSGMHAAGRDVHRC
jgi:hypothetical protein